MAFIYLLFLSVIMGDLEVVSIVVTANPPPLRQLSERPNITKLGLTFPTDGRN